MTLALRMRTLDGMTVISMMSADIRLLDSTLTRRKDTLEEL